jgi:hypothetical protein
MKSGAGPTWRVCSVPRGILGLSSAVTDQNGEWAEKAATNHEASENEMTIEVIFEKPPLLYILPAAVSAIFCAEVGLPGLAAGSPFEDTAEIHDHLAQL